MSSKSKKISICQAESVADIAAVKTLFLEYLDFVEDYLGQGLDFQGTDAEFATFPDIYDAMFLARIDGTPAAACAVKPFADGVCELKRLYCRPEFRGQKLGVKLTEMAIRKAQELDYRRMLLDTDPGLIHANSIYEALGFRDTQRYYNNPMDNSRYMALNL